MKLHDLFLSEGCTLEGDVLRNVVICGPVSKNGRKYSANALRNSVKLYEGLGVYADHEYGSKRKGRRLEERFGHLQSVRYCPEENKVRGDLPFLASHPIAERVRESYAKGLPYFGLSHVADGKGHVKDGVTFVEEVTRIMSVDLVDGAATATLVEQAAPPDEMMGADPFVAAATALLSDSSLTKDDLLKKLGELFDTLRGDGEAKPAGDAPTDTPTMEQLVSKLVEQELAKRTPKKSYLAPKSQDTRVAITEQTTTTVPTERKQLGAWLYRE